MPRPQQEARHQRDSRPRGGRRVLSRGLTFTFALAVPRAIQLVTLPLYAHAMAPEEFGRMALTVAVTLAVIPLLTQGLDTAVFRSWYALSATPLERRRHLSTAASFLLLASNAVALLILVTASRYTNHSDALPTSYLALGLFACSMLLSATIVPLAVLRAQDRLRDYLRVSLVGPAVSVPLTLVAVVWLDLGARGWLGANLIGALLTMPVALHALRDQWTVKLSKVHLRSLISWTVPLVPHGVSHWSLVTSDRLILARSVSLKDLGVYNVGYQAGMIVALLITALNNVVMNEYGRAVTDNQMRGRLPRIVSYQTAIVTGLGLTAALLGPPLLTLLLPTQYGDAGQVLPWVALGYVFFGWYLVPANRIVILAGDVRRLWVASAAAAITSVSLNVAFVPRGGMMAAAVVTAVSYLVLFSSLSLYAWRRHPSDSAYEWRWLGLIVGGAVFTYVLAVLTSPGTAVGDFLTRLSWLSGCIIVLYCLARHHLRRGRATVLSPNRDVDARGDNTGCL